MLEKLLALVLSVFPLVNAKTSDLNKVVAVQKRNGTEKCGKYLEGILLNLRDKSNTDITGLIRAVESHVRDMAIQYGMSDEFLYYEESHDFSEVFRKYADLVYKYGYSDPNSTLKFLGVYGVGTLAAADNLLMTYTQEGDTKYIVGFEKITGKFKQFIYETTKGEQKTEVGLKKDSGYCEFSGDDKVTVFKGDYVGLENLAQVIFLQARYPALLSLKGLPKAKAKAALRSLLDNH